MKTTSEQLKEILKRHEKRLQEIEGKKDTEDLSNMNKNEVVYLKQEVKNIKRFLARKEGSLRFDQD